MSNESIMQDAIRQLQLSCAGLDGKIANQQQTITYLWITVGILSVVSIVALGIALWKNRK